MIRAGKLDRFVTIERAHGVINDAGTVVTTWTAHATTRAELIDNGDIETADANGTTSTDTLTFRMRHLAGVTPADRLRYDGRTFNIRAVKELGRRRATEIRCTSAT